MKIAIGTDHAGFEFKEIIKKYLESKGHEVLDEGTFNDERCDYPDYAKKVGESVTGGKSETGVLVCGSGIGMSMAANKITGVRAALCHDLYTARMCREHNDANVIVLPSRLIATAIAEEMLDLYLSTPFGGGRHEGRVTKINNLDAC